MKLPPLTLAASATWPMLPASVVDLTLPSALLSVSFGPVSEKNHAQAIPFHNRQNLLDRLEPGRRQRQNGFPSRIFLPPH